MYVKHVNLLFRTGGAVVGLGRGRGGGGGRRGVVVTVLMTGGGAIPHVLQQSRAYVELPQKRLLQSKNLSPYSHPETKRIRKMNCKII